MEKDSYGWWNKEGNSWSLGWKDIDRKWYYFGKDDYMLQDTVIDGYQLGPEGTWIEHIKIDPPEVSEEYKSGLRSVNRG